MVDADPLLDLGPAGAATAKLVNNTMLAATVDHGEDVIASERTSDSAPPP
jgi:hypothetical protein